jgi:deoxyribonucleoside regulator
MENNKLAQAIRAARLYYYNNMTTVAIAKELNVSNSTVSRLIKFAKQNGVVDIRIIDPTEEPNRLARIILERYKIRNVHVVPVSELAGEAEWLQRVANFAANFLNEVFESNMVLGIAWGTTLTAVSKHLLRKYLYNAEIVQLNGAGNTRTMGIEYASEIIMRFSQNYSARAHLFPVPAYFDYCETKQALWREGSIKRILNLQERADVLIYSIGAVNAGVPSHVYSGDYLSKRDYKALEQYNVAGDIATVFFRSDGSFAGIPINRRASGPDLTLFQRKTCICVVSGLAKVAGIHAALKGRLMSELIIDEPTARCLVEKFP